MVLRPGTVTSLVSLAINFIVGGRGWEVGGGERYQARAAVFAGEGHGDVLGSQVGFVAAEVVGEGWCGDGGDGDFVEEVGGCAGPLRSCL